MESFEQYGAMMLFVQYETLEGDHIREIDGVMISSDDISFFKMLALPHDNGNITSCNYHKMSKVIFNYGNKC